MIGFSLRILLSWVDQVVVFHHCPDDCSADETFEIIKGLPPDDLKRIVMVGETKPEWHEMRHRQAMLEIGRSVGGTHFVLCDSDEFLTANLAPSARDMIARLAPRHILYLPLYNVRNGIEKYHANGLWGNRIVSVAFCDHPSLGWSGDQFHHREPDNIILPAYGPVEHGDGGVVHLWGASEARLLHKHRLYKIHERVRYPETPSGKIEETYNWCMLDRPPMTAAQWTFNSVPSNWMDGYEASRKRYLQIDREPWQRQYADEQIELYGRRIFTGLSV